MTRAASDPRVDRHFLLQQERPSSLAAVATEELAPDLRMLLFTDGTVTRALEAWTLTEISVGVIDEGEDEIPAPFSTDAILGRRGRTIRRRVVLRSDQREAPVVYAESLILFDRLPAAFGSTLAQSRAGIGEALRSGHLESRRELLWFGLGGVPVWRPDAAPTLPALERTYRVMVEGAPVMAITEQFPLELGARGYELALA